MKRMFWKLLESLPTGRVIINRHITYFEQAIIYMIKLAVIGHPGRASAWGMPYCGRVISHGQEKYSK